jgi:acetyl-CoA C-acetyltransferase
VAGAVTVTSPSGSAIDPRSPCIIGVASRTWHPAEVGEGGAPEPLDMWVDVATAAARDSGGRSVLSAIDSVNLVYCQTCQYDDPPARLAERLGIAPTHRFYSGIGGTTAQQLVDAAAEAILSGARDVVLISSAEALATKRRAKQRGERLQYAFRPSERRPYPWEAPLHPAEIAHDVFQAWLTFALFDNARRAHLGVALDAYRHDIGEMMAPLTEIAARNPDAWFPTARTVDEIVVPTSGNRMVGYPYTKYMVAIMDVDMAAAVIVASHERADALGVPRDQRVYLRGWCYATDPVYVAEHAEMWRSPAMAAAAGEALRGAGSTIDDVAHLDLYSCFASSLFFGRDALGISPDDSRALSVTGGLPYHGGPGSGYMTHSIAQMARELRADPGSMGMVSGVGMTMTKHVFGVYSTSPGAVTRPDALRVQRALDEPGAVGITETWDGEADVAAYSVVHDRDGAPEWALLVCDVAPFERAYARATEPDLLARAESEELVGRRVRLQPTDVDLPTGPGSRNVATLAS